MGWVEVLGSEREGRICYGDRRQNKIESGRKMQVRNRKEMGEEVNRGFHWGWGERKD